MSNYTNYCAERVVKTSIHKVRKITDNHVVAAVNTVPVFLDSNYYGYTEGKNGLNSVVYVFLLNGKQLALSVGNKPIGKKDNKYTLLVKRYNHIFDCAMKDKRYFTDFIWKGNLVAYLRRRFIRQLFRLEFGC